MGTVPWAPWGTGWGCGPHFLSQSPSKPQDSPASLTVDSQHHLPYPGQPLADWGRINGLSFSHTWLHLATSLLKSIAGSLVSFHIKRELSFAWLSKVSSKIHPTLFKHTSLSTVRLAGVPEHCLWMPLGLPACGSFFLHISLNLSFYFLSFWGGGGSYCTACGISVPWPGMELRPCNASTESCPLDHHGVSVWIYHSSRYQFLATPKPHCLLCPSNSSTLKTQYTPSLLASFFRMS